MLFLPSPQVRLSLRRIELTPSDYHQQYRYCNKSVCPADDPTADGISKELKNSSNTPNSSSSSSGVGAGGAIVRRKRHRSSKSTAAWMNHGQTIHPTKGTQQKPAIEKLMKLILEQGETIQQQLAQLR